MADLRVDIVYDDISLCGAISTDNNINLKEGDIKDITTSHYIPKDERTTCQSCGTSFVHPHIRRKHHCRRCGDIYCRPCLQYTRRLNIHAQWDEHGVLCKVCLKCFEERESVLSVLCRSRTEAMADARIDCVYDDLSLCEGISTDNNINVKEGDIKDITTSHYIPKDERTTCQSCGTSFVHPHIRRKHHCRRCGDIYCRPCLQYTRRLNIHAQWDEHGVLCKVCLKCFEEREIVLSVLCRSRTEEFMLGRAQYKEEWRKLSVDLTMEIKKSSIVPVLWRDEFQVDILKECLRLLEGFKAEIGSSETLKTIQELTDLVNVPSWQKSMFWALEKASHVCRTCNGKLGTRKKIRNCRVCGLALCKKCSFRELLVYFRDSKKSQRDSVPRIAVIKYEGSPEVEPKYSLLLHVCKECKEYIAKKQVIESDWFIQKPKIPDIMEQFVELDETFHVLTNAITSDLEQLKLSQSSEVGQPVSDHRPSGIHNLVSTMQNIDINTKFIQEEKIMMISKSLRQNLDKFFSKFSDLKSLYQNHLDLHGCGSDLIKNYIKGKHLFYGESNSHLSKVLQGFDKKFATL